MTLLVNQQFGGTLRNSKPNSGMDSSEKYSAVDGDFIKIQIDTNPKLTTPELAKNIHEHLV